MEIVDRGVLTPSFMDFSLPSEFARRALFYTPQFGHFYCSGEYRVAREHLDPFLLVFVCSGALQFETQEKSFSVQPDEVGLLDCRMPHRYFCTEATEFLWFHFQGNSSAPYAEYLLGQSGPAYAGEHVAVLRKSFDAVLAAARAVPANEHMVSLSIHRILSALAAPAQQPVLPGGLLSPALLHIDSHYADPIALHELAARCSLSVSHFIRLFKTHLGCTPHEYLLAYRLRRAKLLLLSSRLSVEEIAARCGFGSASHFARAFRGACGVTPTVFRDTQF